MELKPIYEKVDCAPLGYDNVYVMVRVNPSGKLVREFATAQSDIIQTNIELQVANSIVQATDTNDKEAFEAAAQAFDVAEKEAKRAQFEYETAAAKLIYSVIQDNEEIPISNRDELNAFSDDYDPHILRYALERIWELRNERVQKARESFRGNASRPPAEGDGVAAA